MSVFLRSILALAICLTLGAGQARAIGGADRDAGSARNPDYLQASKLIEAGDYAGAIPLLRKSIATDSSDADAYNLLGFSHRKLGDVEAALAHYGKALALEPKHRGANEYLGELYLELGQLDKARERLKVLDGACFFGCEEYSELKAKIAAYQAQAGS
ncbi:MAG: tetratricopeptide repeat protein [Alphaproteobacteria bacterium]